MPISMAKSRNKISKSDVRKGGPQWPPFFMAYGFIALPRNNVIGECLEAHAGVAELVDALDLGSSEVTRGGSSPSARTTSFS